MTDKETDEETAEDMIEEMEKDLDKAIKYEEDPVEDYADFRPEQSWQRELYIKRVYSHIKIYTGFKYLIRYNKTCKSTTPIRRNRPKTRS